MTTKFSTPHYRNVFKSFCVGMLVLGMTILSNQAWAKSYTLTGKAYRVLDGDTFVLLDAEKNLNTIRIWGIDCPERRQSFGDKATLFLSSLVVGKPVTVTVKSKDQYGRLVGQVFHEGSDIGLAMVRMGFAWHYVAITKNRALAAAQLEAKKQQLGLWSEPKPTPPWVFRKPKPQ